MTRILTAVILLSASLAAIAGSRADAVAPDFRVGAAVVDISPSRLVDLETQQVCLGGFGIGCSRPAVGEREPLYARALVIESQGSKVVIATSSNIGLFAKYKDPFGLVGAYDIRLAAAQATGIPSTSMIITSDHSHSSPDVNGIWGGVDDEYLRKHATALVRAIYEADRALEPAHLYVGATTYDEPEPDALKNHWDGTGSVLDQIDREFRVLQARRRGDDRVIATLVNFSPHASILDGDDGRASGDWTGVFGNRLAEQRGGVGIAMVGALGGIGADLPDARFDEFVDLVDGLTDDALAAATKLEVGGVGSQMVFIREPVTAPLLLTNLVPLSAQDEGNVLEASIDRSTSPPWNSAGVMGTYVSAIRIGDVLIGGPPGEAYPETSFALSRDVQAREHFIFGLSNDQIGYLVAPFEGVTTTAGNGALYPVMGNDNFALSVNPLVGDHVTCSLLDLARGLGFQTAEESTRCIALTADDGLAPPTEVP
ncbi:MAG TPA: hypothetical protein VGB52_09625 [Actinomycetota bacterium]